MDEVYTAVNDILVDLFNDILGIERAALINGEFSDISTNDMHVIDAVGVGEPVNMSAIAKKMSVTVGSITTAVDALVKKGYMTRERSDEDRRMVYIRLTPKGARAYEKHFRFHHEMVQEIVEHLDDEDKKALIQALARLKKFFMEQKELSGQG